MAVGVAVGGSTVAVGACPDAITATIPWSMRCISTISAIKVSIVTGPGVTTGVVTPVVAGIVCVPVIGAVSVRTPVSDVEAGLAVAASCINGAPATRSAEPRKAQTTKRNPANSAPPSKRGWYFSCAVCAVRCETEPSIVNVPPYRTVWSRLDERILRWVLSLQDRLST
jgi:hypothetical protein